MRAIHSPLLRKSVCSTWHLRPLLAAQWLCSLHRDHVRGFSLYKLSRAKTTLGTHGVKAYTPFRPPQLSEDMTVLLSDKRKGQTQTGEQQKPDSLLKLGDTLTVSKLDETITPGSFLLPKETNSGWSTCWQTPDPNLTSLQYELRELEPAKPTKPKKRTQAYAEIQLQFTSPVSYYHTRLRAAALFLEQNRIVEIHVRVPNQALGKSVGKDNNTRNDAAFEWFWSTRPHLWPSIMLKAMPKGTYFKINPYIGRNEVAWVFACSRPEEGDGKASSPRSNSTIKVEKMRQKQEALDMEGKGVPAAPERKAIIRVIKKRMRDGEELTEADIPLWYKATWRSGMKRRAQKREKMEARIIKKLKTLEERENRMDASKSVKDANVDRAGVGLSRNETGQGQEPLVRFTKEDKTATKGVQGIQNGEKEIEAVRIAAERLHKGVTEERKMAMKSVKVIQDGEKEIEALRIAAERLRKGATKVNGSHTP
ncbi:uncharacterized protein BDZ99DRAFT_475490 [Mytilinidion resinicola]|uniref:Uncharacterized protein n=1 Tax=Mytilinidion resinicola TaxID=574789 RepID=A0A6A6YP65_9PEZI|nr:uncharacterized protein BDZ99DRAFT_475490 [Mytilinidion resinicola]KAF2810570.1 hypothetical protein BDZ99DRAFT_475490 [Mytilinidion resinicola]